MSAHVEHVGKEINIYLFVFAALAVLTVATVVAALVGHHLGFSVFATVSLGILIAVVKGSLVALFFMHLRDERRLIYGTMLLASFFFFAVLLLPLFSLWNSNARAEHIYAAARSEAPAAAQPHE